SGAAGVAKHRTTVHITNLSAPRARMSMLSSSSVSSGQRPSRQPSLTGRAGTFTDAQTNAACRMDRGYRSGYGRVMTGTRAEYMQAYIKIREHAGRGPV